MTKSFSKRLMILDYIITAILLLILFICMIINGVYVSNTTNIMIERGMELSSISPLIPLDEYAIVFGAWIAQLGVSSGCYYMMSKSDHRIQLPMQLVNEMPEELKSQCNMTEIITTVLNTSDN